MTKIQNPAESRGGVLLIYFTFAVSVSIRLTVKGLSFVFYEDYREGRYKKEYAGRNQGINGLPVV